MCEYCNRTFTDGTKYAIYGGSDKAKASSGIRLVMLEDKGAHIEDGQFIQHEKLDNTIFYITARAWNRKANWVKSISMEIKYCPMCGEKLVSEAKKGS